MLSHIGVLGRFRWRLLPHRARCEKISNPVLATKSRRREKNLTKILFWHSPFPRGIYSPRLHPILRDMISACFVSDLHLLSPRSMAEKWMSSIEAACSDSQLIVLGGDILDFRWATLGGHLATLRAGRCWLKELLRKNEHARIVYILGNHDSHPDMQEVLEDLACKTGRLQWYPESYRAADCLFCHGDIIDAGGRAGLNEYRSKFHDERPPSRAAHHAYNVAVAMRLHRTIPTLYHRPRATCTRLSEMLELSPGSDHAPVQRVFFGHTHVPIYELPIGPIQFFNPGAALRHLNFAPITFEIDCE